MTDPDKWAAAIKDLLNWSAPLLPVRLGWILIGAGVLFALYKFAQLFVGRKP